MTSEPPVPREDGAGGPPQPPAGGGVPPGGGQAPFELSEAFNYGWRKFQENIGPVLAAALILIVAGGIVSVLWYLLTAGLTEVSVSPDGTVSGAGLTGFLVSTALLSIVGVLVGFLIQAGIIRGGLAITRGERIDVNTFLSTENLPQVIVAALLIGIGSSIGLALCFIPGIIWVFFTQFTMHFIIDKNLSAVDGIRASFQMVNRNMGSVIGLYLGILVANFIGALLCGIGLLVSFPVTVIATAYAYRRMNGEAVTAS